MGTVIYIISIDVFISVIYLLKLYEVNLYNDYLSFVILFVYISIKLLINIYSNKSTKILLLIIGASLSLIFHFFNAYILLFFAYTFSQLVAEVKPDKLFLSFISLTIVLLSNEMFLMLPISFFSIISTLLITKNKILLAKANNLNYSLDIEKSDIYKDFLNIKRQTKSELYNAKLEERARISQNMHDEIGHTLTGNIMKLEAVKFMTDDENLKTELTKIADNLREGMDSIRKIIKEIKPDDVSLNILGIKKLISDVNQNSDIDIYLDYTSDILHLKDKQWEIVYQNIKESLTNAIKYSRASECHIKFEKFNKVYKVSIKDNGIGCKNIIKSMGVSGMENRMRDIGENIIFDGSNGFSVTMLFSL